MSWYYAGQGVHPSRVRILCDYVGGRCPFTTESSGYEKTILSDLQGAWTLLRESLVETGRFDGCERVLFHIDETMSWESVRNLSRMAPLLLIIRNLCLQSGGSGEIMENIEQVHDILQEVVLKFPSTP